MVRSPRRSRSEMSPTNADNDGSQTKAESCANFSARLASPPGGQAASQAGVVIASSDSNGVVWSAFPVDSSARIHWLYASALCLSLAQSVASKVKVANVRADEARMR